MKHMVDPRRLYQENAVLGASPIELVVILYDRAIDDMRCALTAMKNGDIEARSAGVGHALMVLNQLQGTLDFGHGGAAAKQFEQFYNLVRAKLLEAQMRNSSELMQKQVRFMSEVRDCWVQAKRILQPMPPSQLTPPPVASAAEEQGPKSEWDA